MIESSVNFRLISLVFMLAADGVSLVNWRSALMVLILYPFIAGFFLLAWNPHWVNKRPGNP